MKVGETYEGWEILHNALSAPDYRFEAKRGQSRVMGSSLAALKTHLDNYLARVFMAEAWEQATDRPAQLKACLGEDATEENVAALERELAMTLHVDRITDYMHFSPASTGITQCCRKDMIGEGFRQISLDDWAKAPNITGCPFCHRTWCD